MHKWLVAALAACSAASAAMFPQVTVVEVPINDPALVSRLTSAGYIVDHVGRDGFEVYLRADERVAFDALKLPYRVTEIQPSPPVFTPGAKGLGVYHSYASLTTDLQAYATAFPSICRLDSLGQSVQGRELWALKITDNPNFEEDEPEFKYVSTMHGDEPVGTEMLVYLIDRLLSDYGTDSRITEIVNETELWLVPLMNPDGLAANSRMNAQGLDLNREFPHFTVDFEQTLYDGAPMGTTGRPPEVVRVMEWSAVQSFVLSANLHTGSVVVNYPYDYKPGVLNGQYATAPDDAMFIDISLRYSSYNAPMYASSTFPQGITNGCDWYWVIGGMQDWNYRYLGVNEVTIELATPKRPLEAQLPAYWANNEESMLQYVEAAQIGVRGIVEDAVTGEPVYAAVTVDDNPQRVYTDPQVGDYHRMLLPGTYGIQFTAPGYFPEAVSGVVVGPGNATRVDVAMTPVSELRLERPWMWLLIAVLAVEIGTALNTNRSPRGCSNVRSTSARDRDFN